MRCPNTITRRCHVKDSVLARLRAARLGWAEIEEPGNAEFSKKTEIHPLSRCHISGSRNHSIQIECLHYGKSFCFPDLMLILIRACHSVPPFVPRSSSSDRNRPAETELDPLETSRRCGGRRARLSGADGAHHLAPARPPPFSHQRSALRSRAAVAPRRCHRVHRAAPGAADRQWPRDRGAAAGSAARSRLGAPPAPHPLDRSPRRR